MKLQHLKPFVPPVFVHAYRRIRSSHRHSSIGGLYLSGDYKSWQAAQADSGGYGVEVILEKTVDALLKVKHGQAVYERDSVLFDEIQYAWPLLAGLMWAAAQSGGELNVLDFGGSLGSTYFQNRAFFSGLKQVRWNVVEQAQHVAAGRQWFEDEHLRFYTEIDECWADAHPQIILLSSVLQYVEYPYKVLQRLLDLPCQHLIIDRTPFWDGETDHLCVQHVPAEIYPASYPSWIFSTQRFTTYLCDQWQIVAEFDDPDRLPGPVDFTYRGLIAVRREPTSS